MPELVRKTLIRTRAELRKRGILKKLRKQLKPAKRKFPVSFYKKEVILRPEEHWSDQLDEWIDVLQKGNPAGHLIGPKSAFKRKYSTTWKSLSEWVMETTLKPIAENREKYFYFFIDRNGNIGFSNNWHRTGMSYSIYYLKLPLFTKNFL